MAALVDAPKISPESVAQQAFDAVEAGRVEVLADERSRTIKENLSCDHELIYPQVQEFWDQPAQPPLWKIRSGSDHPRIMAESHDDPNC